MTLDGYEAPPPPRKGDKLFRGNLRDWKNNACLRDGDEYAYREGYRRGALKFLSAPLKKSASIRIFSSTPSSSYIVTTSSWH